MENVVRVRSQSDKKMLSLTFSFDGTQFNFLRGKSEESGRALRRLLLNIEKKVKRAPTEARLLHGDSRTVVSKTTPNVEAWSKENVLAIGDSVYNLWVDVPVVLSLEAQCVMENFPAVPLVSNSVFPCIKSECVCVCDSVCVCVCVCMCVCVCRLKLSQRTVLCASGLGGGADPRSFPSPPPLWVEKAWTPYSRHSLCYPGRAATGQ